MATPEQLRSLSEEATCLICLGYFAQPVSVQCGHTFCTTCITSYWEGAALKGGPYPCPQCQETAPTSTLRPNRHLASIVQILTQVGPPVAPPLEGSQREGPLMCIKHDEKLKLFCEEDQTPICVVCDRSREHQGHTVTPIWEAAQEYKDKFQSYLDDVKRKLESALGLQTKEESNLADLEEMFKIQRKRITSVFDKVQQFLENEKCRRLSILEEKEKRALQEIVDKVSELNSRQASFRSQITELEAKCQQPDVELLKDVKSMLSRFENEKILHPDSGHLKEIEKETEKQEEEEEEEEKEEDMVEEEDLLLKIIESLEWRWARSFAGEVTLDPDTAYQKLVLSEDGRSVRRGDQAQDLPNTPERYNSAPCILGRERLSSGRHYWEVEVGDKTGWTLGVCDESVNRKGTITAAPQTGYWAVWLRDGEYQALSSPSTSLTPSEPPRVAGLFLDYAAGRLTLYNVTDRSLLFTFSGASFPRTLRPFFYPGRSEGGKNGGGLTILPVMEQE